MSEKRKKISIPSNDYKHVYGLSYGSIGAPYYETLENIKALLVDGVKVTEHLKGKTVPLTLENYDKDNSLDTEVPTVDVATVTLSLAQPTVQEGKTTKAIVEITPSEATDKTVTYTSENPTIATVIQDGTVTGVKTGKTNIVATSKNGKVGKAEITVEPAIVDVLTVTLSLAQPTIQEGQTTKATVEINPSNATDKAVTYTSENDLIATVVPDGTVTAVKKGQTNIVATSKNGKVGKAQITVEAAPVPVSGVTLSLLKNTLNAGETTTVSADVQPPTATDKAITYTSENDLVATVKPSGEVTAVGEGTTNIVGRASNGVEGKASITVKIPVSGVTLSAVKDTLTAGETTTVSADVQPLNATDKTVTYSSESDLIASVNPSGEVTAVAEGVTNIVGRASNGVEGKVQITVKPAVATVSLSLSKATLTAGETTTVSADVQPASAIDKAVTYSTENHLVATVEQNGQVTAVGEGTTNIVGRTSNGVEGKAEIAVKPAVATVTLSALQNTLNIGETTTVSADVQPASAIDKAVTYTSESDLIASVKPNGEVTAVGEGTTNIVGRTSNGVEGKVQITVNPA